MFKKNYARENMWIFRIKKGKNDTADFIIGPLAQFI